MDWPLIALIISVIGNLAQLLLLVFRPSRAVFRWVRKSIWRPLLGVLFTVARFVPSLPRRVRRSFRGFSREVQIADLPPELLDAYMMELPPFRLPGVQIQNLLQSYCLSQIGEGQQFYIEVAFSNKRYFTECGVAADVSKQRLGSNFFFHDKGYQSPNIIAIRSSKLAQRVGIGLRDGDDLNWLPVCVKFADGEGRIESLRITGLMRVQEVDGEVVNLVPMSMNVGTNDKILWRSSLWDGLGLSDVLRSPAKNAGWHAFDGETK